jgi:16S rRNA (adenine1518-N6/adenine1519-N6)-dimethyltransferase
VANIPYHVTGLIIRQIFRHNIHLPSEVVLMVQEEVARKITPREKDHSVLSNLIRSFGQPEYITRVSKNCFSPIPKVDSAIIAVRNITPPAVENFPEFLRLIKVGFSARRKTLQNNFSAGWLIDKSSVGEILQSVGIEPSRRAQTLSLEEWKKLYYTIEMQNSKFKNLPPRD